MKKTILLLFVSICGLLPLQANAMMFGTDEKIHLFEGIEVSSPLIKGHRHLGHLVRTEAFILPYSVKSVGYVLSSPKSRMYASVSDAELRVFQSVGLLPETLPPAKLTFFEYLFGNLLWIALALLIVPPMWRMVRGTKEHEETY